MDDNNRRADCCDLIERVVARLEKMTHRNRKSATARQFAKAREWRFEKDPAHLFLGFDLAPTATPPDETEFIEVRPVPFAEALRLVETGEIKDSMTVIAVLHAARQLQR